MKIQDCGGKYGSVLRLGVQTNKGQTKKIAHWKARVWAPADARSYTAKIENTDYHGSPSKEETGFATVTVEYFTTTHESKDKFLSKFKGRPHREEPYPL